MLDIVVPPFGMPLQLEKARQSEGFRTTRLE